MVYTLPMRRSPFVITLTSLALQGACAKEGAPPLPGNPPPNALTLTATPAFGPKVFLSWTAGGPAGVTGYTVERKPKGGVFGVIRVLMGKHVTSMVDAQVAPAFAYRYRVRAWIGLKPSVVSNEVVVPTPAH